ncbi:AmmeMemoRadiSam system radical SAM enzyme [archaeon]|nr:AmmeMemoRadiSam system radical SAM enzyme [archaeon]
MKEALLWEPHDNVIHCKLCRHGCMISEGKRGLCRVRENHDGKLYALTYGKPCSANPDPVEKKPLFHFLPGSQTFSIATPGCNFRCLHCQNSSISQVGPEQVPAIALPPESVIDQAKRTHCESIAYTYTEPTVFFEYAKDISELAHKQCLKNIFVSNGYMSPEMIKSYGTLDAANIDIKGNERFYKEVCGAKLEGVLDSIKRLHKQNVHLELTNLLIPSYNDDTDSIKQIVEFIASLDTSIPLHFSAFYPAYKLLDAKPTPRNTLVKARENALENGLKYVYCGNTYAGDPYENTYCPNCKELLIERHGYNIIKNTLSDAKCPNCRTSINVHLD